MTPEKTDNNDFHDRAIAEWRRQNTVFEQAKKAKLEGVTAAALASMNTIVRILGYEPKDK